MKLSRKTSRKIACLYTIACFALIVMQIVFLTLKCTGDIDWSWLVVFAPIILVFCLPFALVVVVVLALIPGELLKVWKTKKRVEAEAAKYGLERQPGESVGDLKNRIIRRNMISGNYSRKDVKDMILEKFPDVGSCMISINNHVQTITLILHRVDAFDSGAGFTDDELNEIASFAAEYIPFTYTIIARNA